MSAPNRLLRPRGGGNPQRHAAAVAVNLSTLRQLRSFLGVDHIPTQTQTQTPITAAVTGAPASATARSISAKQSSRLRAAKSLTTLQEANPRNLPEVWFNSTFPVSSNSSSVPSSPQPGLGDRRPPDERKVKLGKTLRILQERLPTLLQSPLPQEILAPNISLHLFPSTHPHLPVVSGRVAYIAALWTSPIAWNRVPIVGNVKLEILSERMVSQPMASTPRRQGAVGEQLVVRWRTTKGWSGLPSFVGGGGGAAEDPTSMHGGKDFTGLFIFDFDQEGRVLSHTIETVQEGGDWEKGVGAKVVGLTDWLLGGIRGSGRGSHDGGHCPAFHAPVTRKGR